MLLMILMAFSLHKDLATDIRRREERNAVMHARMEQWLLRESEREVERQEEENIHPTAPEKCPGLSQTGQSPRTEET